MRNKKKVEEVRQLTDEELREEEKRLQKYKKIIKKLWAVYGISAVIYLSNWLVASAVTSDLEKPEPITSTLSHYKHSEEYNDYIADIQRDIVTSYECGEISMEEFARLIEITKDEAHFEEFLRSLDKVDVRRTIEHNDNLTDEWNRVGKTYAGINIACLVSLLGTTVALAKYREKEDGIEEARKKRAGQGLGEITEMGE